MRVGATKMKSKVAFENCDSARQRLQQGKHEICGCEFNVWAATPSKWMKRRFLNNESILHQNMPGPSNGNMSAVNVQSDPAAESKFGNQWFQGLSQAIEDLSCQD